MTAANIARLPPAAQDRLIGAIAANTPWLLPLIRAASAGKVSLAFVRRGASWCEINQIERWVRRPTIAIIGDDDDLSSGPTGFPCARRLARYWARAVLVHAAGGLAEHYELALAGAHTYRRVLLVETDSAPPR